MEAFKLGYEVTEPEELEVEEGDTVICCDILSEGALKAELIDAQVEQLMNWPRSLTWNTTAGEPTSKIRTVKTAKKATTKITSTKTTTACVTKRFRRWRTPPLSRQNHGLPADTRPRTQLPPVPDPQAWIDKARDPANLPLLLTDHMVCELKAAQTALLLVRKYVADESGADALLDWLKPYEQFTFRDGPEPDFIALHRQIGKSVMPKTDDPWGGRSSTAWCC